MGNSTTLYMVRRYYYGSYEIDDLYPTLDENKALAFLKEYSLRAENSYEYEQVEVHDEVVYVYHQGKIVHESYIAEMELDKEL